MTTAVDQGLARRMWHHLEPVHAVFWYAPEVFAEAASFGYDVQTRRPSYFAWRLAPLGAVGPQLAASACYSFSPRTVAARAQRLADLTGPLLGAAFGSGLLPLQSTLGIANVPTPAHGPQHGDGLAQARAPIAVVSHRPTLRCPCWHDLLHSMHQALPGRHLRWGAGRPMHPT